METGAIEHVNALGAGWARELTYREGTGQVWTALGVWPLLAALGAGARGAARTELEQALGLPAEHAAFLARELLGQVQRIPGCGAALGLWTTGDIEAEPWWVDALGRAVWGRLSGNEPVDRAVMDRWARTVTNGLIPRMPLGDLTGVLLVLASAVTVRTRWATPFRAGWFPVSEGPWAGRQFEKLTVDGPELYERISVAQTTAGPVTEVRVAGVEEVDVHLVLGMTDTAPGAVVAAGFELAAGGVRRVPVADLPDGQQWPGLALASVDAVLPWNIGELETAGFTVQTEHDLLERAGLFGLRTASGPGDHFPGISRNTPLQVSQAKQSATAEFSAEGFKGGAVTAIGVAPGAALPPTGHHRIRRATARFDRPFAFLAVHRETGLVLLAGWVAQPTAGR